MGITTLNWAVAIVTVLVLAVIIIQLRPGQMGCKSATRPAGAFLVYRAAGPVYMRREHVRALLQHLTIQLHRQVARTPTAADEALLVKRPLFEPPLGKQEKQRTILIQQALAAIREFENINNIELRRDFCESRYYGGPGDAEEKRRVLNAVQTANLLRKIEREDADEPALTLLASNLQTQLEQLIYWLRTAPPNVVGVIDVRAVERLVAEDIGAAELVIRAPALDGFASAYPQVDADDVAPTPGDAPNTAPRPVAGRSVMEVPVREVDRAGTNDGAGANDAQGLVRRAREALSPVTADLYGRYL